MVREADQADPSPFPARPTPSPVMPAVISGDAKNKHDAAQKKSLRGQYDISLPPILARDLPSTIAAIDQASKGGMITQEQAARMAFVAFAQGDVGDDLDEWRLAVEQRLEQHATVQDQEDEEAQQRLEAQKQQAAGAPKPPSLAPERPTQGAGVPSGGMSGPAP